MASRTRERILDAATALFYEEGILATSMDRIIAEAEVAPMTVYRQFSGKDELVTATLERWSAGWLQWLRSQVEPVGDESVAGFTALWDALEKWFAAERFRGSYVANAATELRSRPDHPAHRVVGAHRTALRQLLEEVARTTGASRPATVALELQMLIDGVTTVAVVDHQPGVADGARAMAGALLDR
jgi:AcrR family transcriptional regulator